MEFAFDPVPHRALQLSPSSEVAQNMRNPHRRWLSALYLLFCVPTVGVTRQHHTYATAMSMTRVVNGYRVNLSTERM